MIRSMTGFGRGELEQDGRVLSVEMRTVNHRFLELSVRMPRGLAPIEQKLRAHLQERLDRGKVNLTVAWKGGVQEGTDLSVNTDLARQYAEALESLRQQLSLREPVTLSHLLGFPDILAWSEPERDLEAAWGHLRGAVDRALTDLVSMRETEGRSLQTEFEERLAGIRNGVEAVEKRAPVRVAEAKERLRKRLAEILEGEAEVDEDRLVLESALQAERMDCTEECVRLRAHLDQFESLLAADAAVGRKLNFLTQEMNRETNTIGAKSNDVAITAQVIQLKEEIEILREQVQNVE